MARDEVRAGSSAPAMDEGVSRIRRRVSVRKRDRPSLGSGSAAPTAAELKPGDEEGEEEEEMMAGSRRRKTVEVQPVEVQPFQLSNSEFLVSLPTLGEMIQIQVSYRVCPLKEHLRPALEARELDTPKFWLFPSYMQTVDQLSTSLHLLTSTLLSLLILTCEVLLCSPHFYIDLKGRPPRHRSRTCSK